MSADSAAGQRPRQDDESSNREGIYCLRQLVGLNLGIALFLLVLLSPAPAGMSPSAQRMAAVALLMATWWMTEAVPIPVTALLPLVLYPALGIMGTAEAAPNYAHQLVFLFLGGFLIASAMVRWGLHRRIALHTILLVGAGPLRLILGFMLATALLSMWISNTATALMMLPIAIAVVSKLSEGLAEGEAAEQVRQNFGLALMLGIAYSASIGGIGTLIGTPPNVVFVGMLDRLYEAAPQISFSKWMSVGLPVTLAMLPLAWAAVVYLAPRVPLRKLSLGGGGREVIRAEIAKLGPLQGGERKVALVFFLTALLWIFRSPLNLGFVVIPGWATAYGDAAGLISDTTIAVAMGVLLFVLPADLSSFELLRRRNSLFVLDWPWAREHVPWGVLLLFGGGFALAQGFSASGLSLWIGQRLQFLEGVPILFVVLAICLVMTFLTEMTSNTATTTLMIPILAVVATQLGEHPFLLMFPATVSASCAFMLPVATPPNAIVFGSGWVTVPRMARTGLLLNLAGALVITALTLLLATAVFGIELGSIPAWATQLKTPAN